MNSHLATEPLYVLVCFALGQSALIYSAIYGLTYAVDRLITAASRRRKARRATQPTETTTP
ncbi:MAG: hypothetical protein ACRDP6_42125 [Actinoallomurus sp.]